MNYNYVYLYSGHSAMLIMDSEGYISIYNLPELKLVYKENCVDASDAVYVAYHMTYHMTYHDNTYVLNT